LGSVIKNNPAGFWGRIPGTAPNFAEHRGVAALVNPAGDEHIAISIGYAGTALALFHAE
jgi:hypothetical protein